MDYILNFAFCRSAKVFAIADYIKAKALSLVLLSYLNQSDN